MSKFKISAFVITKDEENNIRQCLQSLTWADELVVVDDIESIDKTKEIARQFTSKVFSRPWKGFAEQRNFALSQTVNNWIFFLDADEVCSPELIQWLQKFQELGAEGMVNETSDSPSQHPLITKKTDRVDMFEIRRWEHFRGKLYKYGENNPSHQWRFFRKAGAKFVGEVHEYAVFEGDIRRVEKPILHFPRENLTELMDKLNRYTTLDAERLYKNGVKHSVTYMFFSGLAMFLKSYFRKKGYRDGVLGLVMAVFSGTVFFLKQAKLYLRHKKL